MKKYTRERKYVYTAMAVATLMALSSTSPVMAEDNSGAGVQLNTSVNLNTQGGPQGDHGGDNGGRMMGGGAMGMGLGKGSMKQRMGIIGTVSAVSGNTITVTGKKGFGTTATDVTYTVDATNSVIIKEKATGTITDIVVGDTIMVQGTITGTNVVAKVIHDGKMPTPGAMMGEDKNKGKNKDGQTGTNGFAGLTGNGQPIVAGTVTAVSRSTVTITNKSNVTYTIDASSAKIIKGQGGTAVITDISVGDNIIAQGAVNGSAVVATTIIDQAKLAKAGGDNNNNGDNGNGKPKQNQGGGFFGGMGSFFAHIFGF